MDAARDSPFTTLPAQERKGTTNEHVALEMLAERAWLNKDYRLAAVIAATWTLLGWGIQWLDCYKAGREEWGRFLAHATYSKNKRLLRAEARGFARALHTLEEIGLLTNPHLSAVRWPKREDAARPNPASEPRLTVTQTTKGR